MMDPQTLPQWAKPTTEDWNAAAAAWNLASTGQTPNSWPGPTTVAVAETLIARALARMPGTQAPSGLPNTSYVRKALALALESTPDKELCAILTQCLEAAANAFCQIRRQSTEAEAIKAETTASAGTLREALARLIDFQPYDGSDARAYAAILAERDKQIGLGYTPENDDDYTSGDLVRVAECLLFAAQGLVDVARETWPWDNWQPTCFSADADLLTTEDRRKLLVTAAALIVAEISRIDRAAALDGAA